MEKRLPYAVAGLLVLAACGSDSAPTGQALCDKAATVSTNVNKKIVACVAGGQSEIPTGAACTSALTQCNTNDQSLINGVLDCLNGLPTLSSTDCTDLTKLNAWTTQADACTSSSKISGMTSACCNAGGFSGCT